jgi:Mg/Co/Ni transporter MgtE
LLVFSQNRFNLARSIEVLQNHTNLIPVLDEKNSYVGYYEIDDIMSFHQTPFERTTRRIIKVKKRRIRLFHESDTQIVESNNGSFRLVYFWI